MHRVWAKRRAWRVRLWLAIGLALLLFPLAWLVHPAWALGSLMGLLYPSRWEEPRALADLDRQYGLAYRSALEAPPNHPWRDQLQLESQASLRGARLPAWPWVFAALYLLLLGVVWLLPPPYWPAVASPNEAADPASSPAASNPAPSPAQPEPSQPPSPRGSSSEGQQPGAKPEEATSPAQPEEPSQQARDAQGQNSREEAVAQDATRSAQPGAGPQNRGQAPSPGRQEAAQSQQEGIPGRQTEPTQTDQPGQATEPSQTGRRPSGQTEPMQPSQSQPEQAQPSQPGQAQPSQPAQASPAQPGQRPAQGQPRDSEGGPTQTPGQPPRPPQVGPERPAGQVPLSRGENRQGRPAPLPSPWPSGQPPQNVQRQAEKYLESEPLPPEVREVLRRYFELPPP